MKMLSVTWDFFVSISLRKKIGVLHEAEKNSLISVGFEPTTSELDHKLLLYQLSYKAMQAGS